MHGEGINQRLIGFGVVAFIVDQGEVLDLPNELLYPLADCRQGVRKLFGIDAVTLIDIGVKRNLAVAGHQQRETALAQVPPLLLGVAALGQLRAQVSRGQIGKKVRGVIEERIETERKLIDDMRVNSASIASKAVSETTSICSQKYWLVRAAGWRANRCGTEVRSAHCAQLRLEHGQMARFRAASSSVVPMERGRRAYGR